MARSEGGFSVAYEPHISAKNWILERNYWRRGRDFMVGAVGRRALCLDRGLRFG